VKWCSRSKIRERGETDSARPLIQIANLTEDSYGVCEELALVSAEPTGSLDANTEYAPRLYRAVSPLGHFSGVRWFTPAPSILKAWTVWRYCESINAKINDGLDHLRRPAHAILFEHP